jgi:hypothetical protein
MKYIGKFIQSFDNCSWNFWSNFRKKISFLVICFWVSVFCNRWVYRCYGGKYCFQSQGAFPVQSRSHVSFDFLRNVGIIIQYKAENSMQISQTVPQTTEDTENLISKFCSIQMEHILKCNEQTGTWVSYIFVNKRVSGILQWILIYSW